MNRHSAERVRTALLKIRIHAIRMNGVHAFSSRGMISNRLGSDFNFDAVPRFCRNRWHTPGVQLRHRGSVKRKCRAAVREGLEPLRQIGPSHRRCGGPRNGFRVRRSDGRAIGGIAGGHLAVLRAGGFDMPLLDDGAHRDHECDRDRPKRAVSDDFHGKHLTTERACGRHAQTIARGIYSTNA